MPDFDPSSATPVGFDPSSATPMQPQGSGILPNFAAGAGEAITGMAGMFNPLAAGARVANDVSGIYHGVRAMFAPNDQAAQGAFKSDVERLRTGSSKGAPIPLRLVPGSTENLNEGLGQFGLNPEDVVAATPGEKAARWAGQGATAILAPESAPRTVASMFARGATGAISGVGAGAAADAAPEPLKPLAALIGGVLTGTGAHIATSLPGKLASASRSALDPFIAAASEPTAQRMAGTTLKKASSNPQRVADILAPPAEPEAAPFRTSPSAIANEHALEVARLEAEGAAAAAGQPRPQSAGGPSPLRTVQNPNELVPGSQPTTFQLTGDVGLGALERGVAARNPELFNARRADQNAARLSVLGTIQNGGNAADVATAFRTQLNDLDADTAAHAHDLLTQAQSKAQALGGMGTPEHYGDALRTVAKQADDASRERESALWQAVDPSGDLTGNVTATRNAARDIADQVSRYAKPMSGEENSIFEAAQTLKPVQPVSDLIALRSRVSTEMRNELAANGRSPSYARLAQLRGAIQNNLSTTISESATDDAAQAASGAMPQAQTLGARLEAWRNEWLGQRQAQTGAASATGGGSPSAAGPAGFSEPLRAPGQGGTGFYDTAGPGGLPPDAGPTFDPAAAERLKAATSATKEQRGTFGRGPVGQVLANAGAKDLFKLPEARVPEKFFHPGPTGFTDMQALSKAIGPDKAVPLMTDYAASSLRRAALNENGALDPAKFARWQAAHADALRALPTEVRTAFSNAAKATQALEEASAARQAALKDMQAGALGRLMGATTPEDATRHIASIFGTRDSVAMIRNIAKTVAGDPAAKAGLRQAVADHIAQKFISNTEAGTSGQNLIKSDMFQSFLKNNRAALGQVFDPKEMESLQAIADDLHRANRSVTAIKLPGGSNTAQDILAASKSGAAPSKLRKYLLDAAASGVGFGAGGPWGMAAAGLGAHALQAARETGFQRVDQLVAQALLNPDLARELLKKASATGPAADVALARAIRRSVAGTAAQMVASQTVH